MEHLRARASEIGASRPRICFIVAPSGAAGGGMGRVKDYILQSCVDPSGSIIFRPLVTRDDRGLMMSLWLTLCAVAVIFMTQVSGRLAFIHVNMGDRASVVRKGLITVAARLTGATVVLHLHAVELERHYRAGGWVLRRLVALPFRIASTNVVLGRYCKRWLVDELGVNPEKVDVVTNGVPLAVAPHRQVRNDANPISLLFLGTLTERKGVSDLLNALAKLASNHPPWHLVMAGGGDIQRYRGLANELGVIKKITFAGWVDQSRANALVRASDLLILPSYEEGLPLVILEALGSGTPVLCTAVGAIPEVLADGDTAIFSRPGDVDHLALKISETICNPMVRQALSDRGRDEFSERFTMSAFRAAIFDVYRRRCRINIQAEPTTPSWMMP